MSSRRRFWFLTLAAVLGVALTLSLGRWQLQRAAQKEALQSAIEERGKLPDLDTRTLQATRDLTAVVHRHATLRGTWIAQHTILLDNRQMNAKPGFFVLTPLQLEGSEQVLLVQRGWVQRDFSERARVPRIESPPGFVTVRGRLALPPSRLFELGRGESAPDQAGAGAPGPSDIRQNVETEAFAAEIGRPLLGVSLLQTDPASQGLLREWPAPNTGIERHYGYAFQWFSLSGLIAVLYFWFQWIAPYVRTRRVA